MKHLTFSAWALIIATLFAANSAGAQHFGPWSAPVNVGAPVNSDLPDGSGFITKDRLRLYFYRGEGLLSTSVSDLWVAQRSTPDGPWESTQMLPAPINIPGTNSNFPFLTVDGHCMYFNSNRKTADANGVLPFGRNDLYVACRSNKRNDGNDASGWQEPVNLGPGVNTGAREQSPWIHEDDETGVTTLYFNSDRFGTQDIFVSRLQADGTFGPAEIVPELSSPYNDEAPTVSRNGLELYFISDRPGSTLNADGSQSNDIWVSTRATTSDPWGVPQNLDVVNASLGGPAVNSPYHEGRAALSFDGKTIYFASAKRAGNVSWAFDIWKVTREKLTGGKE